ncbi:MAG: DUF6868 family protein [Planctomycetota bacterium]|jgi:membrane-bound metal-dependent hydrolase YbcI (DUF457 family)
MDVSTLKAFFLWCTIINAAVLLFSSLMCILFADFSYRMNHMFFSISRPQFNVILVSFLGLYKIFVMAFNLVPYIALVIID